MAAKVKIRGKIKAGVAEVKTLMPHPMETGTRRNAEGEVVPAHYIEEVTCFKNDKLVIQAFWGPAVSKNPFFSFKVKDSVPGDVIRVSWVDNLGETSSGELVLK
jgi:sulfur-oxidizing protein SoxZ